MAAPGQKARGKPSAWDPEIGTFAQQPLFFAKWALQVGELIGSVGSLQVSVWNQLGPQPSPFFQALSPTIGAFCLRSLSKMLRLCGPRDTHCSFWELEMCGFFGGSLEMAELRQPAHLTQE